MGLQAEAPDTEAQGVLALQLTAWAEPGPRLVVLADAYVHVLYGHFCALSCQRQEPVLQLRQQAPRGARCSNAYCLL